MEPHADMICLLKIDVHCETCKMKMLDVLSSISGVYSVTIDAQEKSVKVAGQVDPNILLRALSRADRHAELVWVKLNHSGVSKGPGPSYSGYYPLDYSYYGGRSSFGPRDHYFEPGPFRGHGPLPGSSWYEPDHYAYQYHPGRGPINEYPFARSTAYRCRPFNGTIY